MTRRQLYINVAMAIWLMVAVAGVAYGCGYSAGIDDGLEIGRQ